MKNMNKIELTEEEEKESIEILAEVFHILYKVVLREMPEIFEKDYIPPENKQA